MVEGRQAGRAGWRHFPHDADVGICGFGPTPASAFEQAGLALTAVVTDRKVAAREAVAVRCEAPALDILFVEWLNAVIYEMAVRKMLFGAYEVRLSDSRIEAIVRGEKVDVARDEPAVEIKGATYTALEVARGADGLWRAQCVIDV